MKFMESFYRSGQSPNWFNGFSYLTVMGSRAYKTNVLESDYDFVGFLVPPVSVVFPHTKGDILGFGRNIQNFEQIQFQHMQTEEYGEVDVTLYNIVKYFQLLMGGNPNIVDSIFTNKDSIYHTDEVGKLVKENRHLFLSEKNFHTFRGMLHAHLSRIKSGHVKEGRKYDGQDWDWKDGYHCMRMCFELDEILFEGNLTIDKNSEPLMDVRNGKVKKEELVSYCESYLSEIEEKVNNKSSLKVPHSPDEKKIKRLLLDCLDIQYGKEWKTNVGYGRYE